MPARANPLLHPHEVACWREGVGTVFGTTTNGEHLRARFAFLFLWPHPHFDLAHILELRETRKNFSVRDDFGPDKYLSGTFQVNERSERHKVCIRFFGVAARFTAEEAWHPYQKLTRGKDGSVILEMTLADVDEVAWWPSVGDGTPASSPRPNQPK